MNIGQTASASGISPKMVRYYEKIGLIDAPPRTDAGYRVYTQSAVHTLTFIRRARDLGFSIEQMRELLALWRDRQRASAEVKQIALTHVQSLREKSTALAALAASLEHLARNCHGDDRPDCPILDELASTQDGFSSPARSTPLRKARHPRA